MYIRHKDKRKRKDNCNRKAVDIDLENVNREELENINREPEEDIINIYELYTKIFLLLFSLVLSKNS